MSTRACVCARSGQIFACTQAQGDWKGAKQRPVHQSDKRQEEQKKRETQREGIERAIDEMKEREAETQRGR